MNRTKHANTNTTKTNKYSISRLSKTVFTAMAMLLCVTSQAFAQLHNTNNKAGQTLQSSGRVNPSTLGMEIDIPLAAYPGRGINVPINLSYSSKVWRMGASFMTPTGPQGNDCTAVNSAQYAEKSASGWTSSLGTARVEVAGSQPFTIMGAVVGDMACDGTVPATYSVIKRVQVHLPNGESHEMRASDTSTIYSSSAQQPSFDGTYYSVDGSKMMYIHSVATNFYRLYLPDGSYYDFDGTTFNATVYKDVNGNQLTFNQPNATYPNGYWTDTMNRTIPVPISPTAPAGPGIQNYSLPGIANPYKFTWKLLKNTTAAESGLTNFADALRYKGDMVIFPVNTPPLPANQALFHSDFVWALKGSGVFNPIVLTDIELPNGQKYKFSYNVYGEIDKVIYPTGGEESFVYNQVASISGDAPVGAVNETSRGVTSRSIRENSAATPSTYTYATAAGPTSVSITTTAPDGTRNERYVHRSNDPGNFTETWGFDNVLAGMPYEERNYNSLNQLISKKLTTWTKTALPSPSTQVTADWHPRVTREENIVYDTAGNALSASTTYEYTDASQIASIVNVSRVSTYGFTATLGGFGPLQNTVETTYITDPNYLNANLKALPATSTTKDPGGNIVAMSQIYYDEVGYGTPYRGQPTTARSWLNTNNSWLESKSKYDAYGNVIQTTDPRGNISYTFYDTTYNALPVKVRTPVPDPSGVSGSSVAFDTDTTYDFVTGLPLTVTDANGQVTTMQYNDPLLRPTQVTPPTGGSITQTIYNDVPGNIWVKNRAQIDATNWKETITYIDGLGRTKATESSDTQGNVFTEMTYDNMGRPKQSTNPYRTGETKQWTTTNYDEAGRVKEVITPDTAKVQFAYGVSTSVVLGTVKTVTDQANKQRRGFTDALGRTVRVIEDPAGQNLATDYVFDTLGNLRQTIQGVQNRYFMYDSLSRLIRAKQPEQDANAALAVTDPITGNSAWSVAYAYDNSGNIVSTTDSRGISVGGVYDNLNRLKFRDYSDVTPDVTFRYDDPAVTFSKGKLTKVSTTVSETRYTQFNNLGRLLSSQQATSGQTYTFGYAYNLAGELVSEVYPSGRTITNVYRNDGKLSQVNGQLGAASKTYASTPTYTSAGDLQSLKLGNNRWENAQFNNRLQVTQIGLGTTSTTQNVLKIDYGYGTSTQNNGSLLSQTITVPSGFTATQTYAYDSLNRIQSSQEVISAATTWRQTFTYDRYGNRRFDAANTTTLGTCPQARCNPTIDVANNRFTTGQGYTYDLGGNLIQDTNGKQYAYDAENHQKSFGTGGSSTNGGLYLYDGDGKRVKKTVGTTDTIFVYDAMGELAAEYLTTTAAQVNTTQYLTMDHLGSTRIVTNQAGAVISRHDYFAYGDEIGTTQRTAALKYVVDNVRQKYTGYERDTESGLDFAQARYYNAKHGRFTSVDPLTASAAIKNPQTFNRYSYVLNSPYKFTDPLGLAPQGLYSFCGNACSWSDGGVGLGNYDVMGGYWWNGEFNGWQQKIWNNLVQTVNRQNNQQGNAPVHASVHESSHNAVQGTNNSESNTITVNIDAPKCHMCFGPGFEDITVSITVAQPTVFMNRPSDIPNSPFSSGIQGVVTMKFYVDGEQVTNDLRWGFQELITPIVSQPGTRDLQREGPVTLNRAGELIDDIGPIAGTPRTVTREELQAGLLGPLSNNPYKTVKQQTLVILIPGSPIVRSFTNTRTITNVGANGALSPMTNRGNNFSLTITIP